MTLRTKTLTAVAALTLSATGFALAQEGSTTTVPLEQPGEAQAAPENGTTFVATPDEAVEAPAEEAAAEEPAAEEAATEEAAAEEPAAEDAAAEEADAEEPAAEDAATEEAAAEEPAAEEAATEEAAAEEPAAEDAATEEAAAEEPAAEDAATEEAAAEEPAAEDAATEEAAAEEPAAEEAATEEAAAEEPAAEEAATEEAAAEEPAAEEAAAEEPAAEEAATEEAAAEEPAAEDAATEEAAAEEGDHGDAAAEGEDHGGGGDHGAGHVEDIAFSFEGPFGTYDQFQLQRGLQVYTEVCSACHGMKFVPIRTLHDSDGPGLPEDQVRAYAANLPEITDDETGEDRTRLPTDHFPTVSGDGMGPDLSLMAKARAGFHGPYGTGINQFFRGIGGPEYIHAILTGYTGEEMEQAGTFLYGNSAFPGGYISMPVPLSDDLVTYEDGTPATVDQMARDVSAFLMWTAEPKMMDRKQVGLASVLMLIVLTALLYLTNKRIWARHKGKKLDH